MGSKKSGGLLGGTPLARKSTLKKQLKDKKGGRDRANSSTSDQDVMSDGSQNEDDISFKAPRKGVDDYK